MAHSQASAVKSRLASGLARSLAYTGCVCALAAAVWGALHPSRSVTSEGAGSTGAVIPLRRSASAGPEPPATPPK